MILDAKIRVMSALNSIVIANKLHLWEMAADIMQPCMAYVHTGQEIICIIRMADAQASLCEN